MDSSATRGPAAWTLSVPQDAIGGVIYCLHRRNGATEEFAALLPRNAPSTAAPTPTGTRERAAR